MKLIIVRLILAVFFINIAAGAYAGIPLTVDDETSRYPLGKNLEIFEDKEGKYSLNNVLSDKVSKQFRQNKTSSPSYGFTSSVFWVRFTVKSSARETRQWLLELDYPLMDKISLFVPREDGVYCEKKYGYSLPFLKRDVLHRNFIFKLDIAGGETKTYYFRFENADRMEIPLTIWSGTAFQEKDHIEQYILGLYYGILLVMVLYNFFIFISIRDKAYLFYVLYIIFFMFYQMTQNGLAYELFYPDTISNHYVHIINVFLMISILQFVQLFLHTERFSLKVHKTMTWLKAAFLLSIVPGLFLSYGMSIVLVLVLVLISGISILSSGIIGLAKGYRPAKYFTIAWISLGIGAMIYIFKVTGFLPNNYFTSYSIQVGSALEVILLSLGLGDRINILREEKEAAAGELLRVQKTYSESLERTVQERTRELQEERNQLKFRNEIMEKEINLARKIQEHLIPSKTPASNIASLYKPMEQVGGDFYDFITFDDSNKIGIFLSDVSGHGVPSAFITSMIKTIILQAGVKKENPAELLHFLNEILADQTGGYFITVFYGIYDSVNHEIEYSNAGHNSPFIISDKKIQVLKGHRSVPVAMMNNLHLEKYHKIYQNSCEKLIKGNKLLLYTDGLTECRSRDNGDQFFEYSEMESSFLKYHKLECGPFVDSVYKELVDFRGSSTFEDDVCMICLDV